MKLAKILISGLLLTTFTVATFTGCGCTQYETGNEKVYSYDEAMTELEAFNKEIKTDTKTPTMDIYDDETTNKALADISTFPITTQGEGEINLEIAAPSESLAELIISLFGAFDIRARSSMRKAKHVVYLKRAEDISDMLTLLGAAKAMMAFENIRVKKEVSNRVNRQLNCDSSNINRVMNAAENQIRDIRYIDEELGLDKLPVPLREMAFTRANNPETPLGELGELMTPPLGKSGVSARLRRLSDIADKLRSGEEIRL